MMMPPSCVLATVLWMLTWIKGTMGQEELTQTTDSKLDCSSDIRQFDPRVHKEKYRIAVHAIRGFEAAYQEYNKTFAEYLTSTAGKRYDPPITFEMVPVNFQGLFDAVEEEAVDLFYANPGIYSCVGVEDGAQPLATVVSRLTVRGHTYDLDVVGGVMFTRADNDEITGVTSLADKVIGAGGISMMMAAQLQFHEMDVAGLSYVMDPKQVVFTGNQLDVVNGVLDGQFDVGFVRTDQIERSTDAYGNVIDPDLFKVIEPKIFVLDNGNLFPFLHSTEIYAEWPVAALNTVPKDVAEEVQKALLALQSHSEAHDRVEAGQGWNPNRCDTTAGLAELASTASKDGKLAGFRSARSYFEVRTMQEESGFILKDKGNWKCTRADTLYNSISCPEDHYKLPIEEYEQSCGKQGLVCMEGYDCYCKPCVRSFEVDVYEWTQELEDALDVGHRAGCEKMSLCGVMQQTKTINFRLVDNKKRDDAVVEVRFHLAKTTMTLPVTRVGDHTYEFSWSENNRGVAIFEVYVNGEQIPQSPIRVQVDDRDCELDYPGQRRSNDDDGTCQCSDGTMDISGRCVESTVMAIVISVSAVLIIAVIGIFYVRYRNRKNDQVWLVNVDELTFDDPPEVIGQGSFGVVLLSQYRGTKVALKRALKARSGGSKRGSKRSRKGSRGGSKRSGKEHSPADSVGLSSVDTDDQSPETDPELGNAGQEGDEESKGSGMSRSSGAKSGSHNGSRSRSRSGSRNPHSLGFLAEDFGPTTKWGWLLPWIKKNDYNSRFKEAIFSSDHGSSGMNTKTWHAKLCPWFNAQVRAEEEFIAEMRVLSRLRHPNITTVLGAVISNTHDPMLVMEYMEYGSLHDLLSNETMHLSGEIIMQISRDVAQGLRFLHSSKPPILHGDLKGRNILVDSRFKAKLCDFGLSVKKTSLITGTPYWLAPEYLRGQTHYTPQCDMYSMGIVFYEMYARDDPYKGEDFRDTLRKVCDRRVNKRPPLPPTCPSKMADIMKKCWSPDPFFRYQAKDLDTVLLDMNMRDAEPLTSDEQMALHEKRRKKGDMLYDLFPKHIADALKTGQKVEPEQHDEVTVVFSEIMNFADILSSTSPMKVSNMLDRLYLAFDKVAGKHKVFKVETVGDAYMGVTNLEKNMEDTHVKQAALFAIDMVIEASNILIDEDAPNKGFINIRAGFHSGPVVSNVIGSLNPRYGLFGDTVNTSSRMESNSKANRVLCSEIAYKLLAEQAPEITVKKRGRIAVKGKGDMIVYWVGDEEIFHGKNDSPVVSPLPEGQDAKLVKFSDPENEDDRENRNEAVDDHIWRRGLQTQLNRLDSGASAEQEEAIKSPRHVKSAVREGSHFTRGSNVV